MFINTLICISVHWHQGLILCRAEKPFKNVENCQKTLSLKLIRQSRFDITSSQRGMLNSKTVFICMYFILLYLHFILANNKLSYNKYGLISTG